MYVSVDIESDGPIPGKYSMISLGAVIIEPNLDRTFYTGIAPISKEWVPEALAVSGFTREKTLTFASPKVVMQAFVTWLDQEANGQRPRFVADNAGFDWMFVAWYFHTYLGHNPFGFSPMSLTWLYKGLARNTKASHKSLRRTKHTHNALDDAKGNAEAFLVFKEQIKGL
jgi:DNA polymerase III alpha subunit (gram-positive type)